MTKVLNYSLSDFEKIKENGFDLTINNETMEMISFLSINVGCSSYSKSPVFKKNASISRVGGINQKWNKPEAFKATKIEQKEGIQVKIDLIRSSMNKITDKNYIDLRNKIVEILDDLIKNDISKEEMTRIASFLFEIASNNRFYSKIYADLYSDLSLKYGEIQNAFQISLSKFMLLFDNIEYVDPLINYDKFCMINKENEKRKALSNFFLNLMYNGIIEKTVILHLIEILLQQIDKFIHLTDKINEVDEIIENISILFKEDMFKTTTILVNNMTIYDYINHLAKSKNKIYPSLTNKSVFKCMDICKL
jgi:hypothetical protein